MDIKLYIINGSAKYYANVFNNLMHFTMFQNLILHKNLKFVAPQVKSQYKFFSFSFSLYLLLLLLF